MAAKLNVVSNIPDKFDNVSKVLRCPNSWEANRCMEAEDEHATRIPLEQLGHSHHSGH